MVDVSLAPVCCVSERVGVLEVNAPGVTSATSLLAARLARGSLLRRAAIDLEVRAP
jgi:hypothetical protein